MRSLLQLIKPHLNPNRHCFIGSICCYGGFEWVVRRELGVGNYSCFGTNLIPWCCGTKEYGRVGVVFGAKRLLRIVTSQGKVRESCEEHWRFLRGAWSRGLIEGASPRGFWRSFFLSASAPFLTM